MTALVSRMDKGIRRGIGEESNVLTWVETREKVACDVKLFTLQVGA